MKVNETRGTNIYFAYERTDTEPVSIYLCIILIADVVNEFLGINTNIWSLSLLVYISLN